MNDFEQPPVMPTELSIIHQNYNMRQSLLQSSDWTQLPDSPLDEDTKAQWREYRQKLRDLDHGSVDCVFPLAPGQKPPASPPPPVTTPLPTGL